MDQVTITEYKLVFVRMHRPSNFVFNPWKAVVSFNIPPPETEQPEVD